MVIISITRQILKIYVWICSVFNNLTFMYYPNRFLHPIVYGEYPKTMQKIVGDRLPKFTHDEVKMVKGSFDYVGINQYTTYYVYDPSPNTSSTINYQNDWNAIFACKIISPLSSLLLCHLIPCWIVFDSLAFIHLCRWPQWSANWSKGALVARFCNFLLFFFPDFFLI